MDSIERRVRTAIASTEAEGIKLSADGITEQGIQFLR